MLLGMKNIIDPDDVLDQEDGAMMKESAPPLTTEMKNSRPLVSKSTGQSQTVLRVCHPPQLTHQPASANASRTSNLMVEDQITTFLEMESHCEQISSLQMEVQRLREDLRQEKADKAALKDEVIRLKLYIVDHCLKEKRGQSHRTNDTPFLEVGSFETEEDTSKDLPALPQPPPSFPTRATPQTSKTKASPTSNQEAVPQTPPYAPTLATPQTSKTIKASPSSSQEAVPETPPSAPTPATPQTSKTKASPSNQEDQETKLLVNDPSDPNRYAHIRVSRVGYRTMVHKASRAKDGAKKLMNNALDLVFSREQLAASSGMGLRKEKDAGATVPHPLDAVKIAAILDFTKSFSKSQGWALPMDKELRRIVTNKVTNARRK
ncbi:uncharacterized protein LOC105438999 isoform X2 [Strongylocentrotus purpuratus]|uniref:BEN domain-containing protein n=1 Tax=Strongylocentrotus purpuratus TaxID=7668 RepID=A0A7M7T381_STRPU|nr:uncharacterized protein LOC105438999 isoform X2 [Strongylocentrotus purpuratus]